jgi:predicted nicotinamide N-methyase
MRTEADELVERRIDLPGERAPLRILQPADSAELPDDGGVEWAPLVPYWSVLWRSGVALAEEVAAAEPDGRRVAELGCGLALPSIAAARVGAEVIAVDVEPDAIELLERNAALGGVEVEGMVADWTDPGPLLARAPFDLAIAADVLYEPGAAAALAELLPLLAREAWIADPSRPGRPPVDETLAAGRSKARTTRGVVTIHRLAFGPAGASG